MKATSIQVLMTPKNVAERLAISLSKVYSLIDRGTIGYYRIGGSIRVSEEQLNTYLTGVKR
jgi:excisionase family DNA binding protein